MLRPDKRARPLVLRMNAGDCLAVEFENLLAPIPSLAPVPSNGSLPFLPSSLKTQPDPNPVASTTSQSATRLAGVHVMGNRIEGSDRRRRKLGRREPQRPGGTG